MSGCIHNESSACESCRDLSQPVLSIPIRVQLFGFQCAFCGTIYSTREQLLETVCDADNGEFCSDTKITLKGSFTLDDSGEISKK